MLGIKNRGASFSCAVYKHYNDEMFWAQNGHCQCSEYETQHTLWKIPSVKQNMVVLRGTSSSMNTQIMFSLNWSNYKIIAWNFPSLEQNTSSIWCIALLHFFHFLLKSFVIHYWTWCHNWYSNTCFNIFSIYTCTLKYPWPNIKEF